MQYTSEVSNRLVHALASPTAMWITLGLTAYWIYVDPATWYDTALAAGAMILAQAIFRAGEPRERAIHKKLDEIIHGTDADDTVAGIEID
jgi:low affinity Fe/Cu permease